MTKAQITLDYPMELETSLKIPPVFARALNAAENIARGLKSDVTPDILFFALLSNAPRSFALVLSNALIDIGLSIESIVEYARGFCKKGRKKDDSVRLTKGAQKIIDALIATSKKIGADYIALEFLPISFLACIPNIYAYILASEKEMGVEPKNSFIQCLQEQTTDFLDKSLEIASPDEEEKEKQAPELNFCKNLNKEAEVLI